MQYLGEYDYPENVTLRKKNIISALDQVAAKLGNTRAICKKSYVLPALLEEYESGNLAPYLKKAARSAEITDEKSLNQDEKILLNFLKVQREKKLA